MKYQACQHSGQQHAAVICYNAMLIAFRNLEFCMEKMNVSGKKKTSLVPAVTIYTSDVKKVDTEIW